MAKTLYSHEIRSLLCSNCGAPIEIAVLGGTMRCEYCGTSHQVAKRDESADIQHAEKSVAVSESERLEMLRMQDASPRPLPAGLERYLLDSEIAPDRVNEALGLWQRTRQQVERGAAFPDQDRLYFLTILLAPAVDDRTRRGLLESAVDLLPDVRHRQVLRCSMAENAVLAGDLEAARQWLRPCNARSTDLQMDTAYRVAAAVIATAESAYPKVLSLLGNQPGDIPLADEAEAKAELIRADAVERTWGPAVATEQLVSLMFREPRRLAAFERAVKELGSLGLCPHSGAVATKALWQAVNASLRPSQVTSLGCLALGSLIPAGGMLIVLAGASGLVSDEAAVRVNMVVHPLIWLVVLPVVLILVAYHNRKRKLALRDFGQLSMARVTASSSRVQHGKNSTTTYQDLSIQVLVGGRYLPVSRSLARKQPVPLGVYPCLVDPQSPQRVSIQLDPLAQNLR